MDEQLVRLLEALEQQGASSRTLIAVIGDHGESLGEHGEMTHGVFLYDSTLRVPFILAGPDVPAGKVIDDQVRSIDVMPTLAAFLRLSPGPEAQGTSLWPLTREGVHVRSNYSYGETLYPRTYMGWSELRAMRTDQWKLVVAPHPELYNLQHDPDETENLIGRYPAEADQLQKKIWEIVGEQARHEKVLASPMDTETRQELESLGYVSAATPREIHLCTGAPDPKDRVAILNVLEQGEKDLNTKAYASTAKLLEQVKRWGPADPLCALYLATAYEKTGQEQRAIQVYQVAIDLNVRTDLIYSRLGRDHLRIHDLPKAAEAMARASQINPTDLDNLRNLGTAYLHLGRIDDAEKAFKAILVQNDRYASAYNGLELVAVQRSDAGEARRNFEKALEVDPDEMEPLLNLGVLYQRTGRRELALRYLELFLRKAPANQYKGQLPVVREAVRELRQGL